MAGLSASLNAAVLILCGAVNALLSKVVYQLQGQDCSGDTKPFQKPWLQTALMFVAMALCLPIGWGMEAWQQRKKKAGNTNNSSSSSSSRRHAAGAVPRKVIAIATAGAAAEAPAGTTSTAAAGAGAAAAGDASDLSVPLLAARAQDRLQQHEHDHEHDREDDHEVHGSGSSSGAKFILKEGLMLCIPTGFDLAATTLMNVGLLYVAASVFQILRGSEMLFAALFAVLFLKRHLNKWHFMGVALCMTGISLVGVSRVLAGNDSSGADSLQDLPSTPSSSSSTEPSQASITSLLPMLGIGGGVGGSGVGEGGAAAADPKKALLGMCLIILSQAIQAGQVTVEDHFMSEMGMHPLKVVGWEGVIGSVVMLGGALPLLQRLPFEDGSGLAEDSVGSWCMVKSSTSIAVVLFLSSAAVLVYNISGMSVTEQVGAAARTVLENARTLLVWLAGLGLFYLHIGSGGVSLGEAWDSWSWLQAVGFAVFAAGALLYDKGHKQEEAASIAAGQTPKFSKWAVLKSTLNIHAGHYVGLKTFRAAANSVMAAQRLARLAEEGSGDISC
ncbi:hypothetical protein OEZ85_003481 [Tetradesmus obliquus]|uniref:EamA domain-containing protein n=1 Tax=Tetradesmus obliquus TaxID=3088 RepID=A0ABY8UGL1_TETOB|nr:hypothetical protein OEZ85_003481 [Tetradesmus obliquus]